MSEEKRLKVEKLDKDVSPLQKKLNVYFKANNIDPMLFDRSDSNISGLSVSDKMVLAILCTANRIDTQDKFNSMCLIHNLDPAVVLAETPDVTMDEKAFLDSIPVATDIDETGK